MIRTITFDQLVSLLKNNNFDFYYNKPRSRSYKSDVIIKNNSIEYRHGVITNESCKDKIYLFDNNFITFDDYTNYYDIKITIKK